MLVCSFACWVFWLLCLLLSLFAMLTPAGGRIRRQITIYAVRSALPEDGSLVLHMKGGASIDNIKDRIADLLLDTSPGQQSLFFCDQQLEGDKTLTDYEQTMALSSFFALQQC